MYLCNHNSQTTTSVDHVSQTLFKWRFYFTTSFGHSFKILVCRCSHFQKIIHISSWNAVRSDFALPSPKTVDCMGDCLPFLLVFFGRVFKQLLLTQNLAKHFGTQEGICFPYTCILSFTQLQLLFYLCFYFKRSKPNKHILVHNSLKLNSSTPSKDPSDLLVLGVWLHYWEVPCENHVNSMWKMSL